MFALFFPGIFAFGSSLSRLRNTRFGGLGLCRFRTLYLPVVEGVVELVLWKCVILESVEPSYTRWQRIKRWWRILWRWRRFRAEGENGGSEDRFGDTFEMPMLRFINREDSARSTRPISLAWAWMLGFDDDGWKYRANLRTVELPYAVDEAEWTPEIINRNPYTIQVELRFVEEECEGPGHLTVLRSEPDTQGGEI